MGAMRAEENAVSENSSGFCSPFGKRKNARNVVTSVKKILQKDASTSC